MRQQNALHSRAYKYGKIWPFWRVTSSVRATWGGKTECNRKRLKHPDKVDVRRANNRKKERKKIQSEGKPLGSHLFFLFFVPAGHRWLSETLIQLSVTSKSFQIWPRHVTLFAFHSVARFAPPFRSVCYLCVATFNADAAAVAAVAVSVVVFYSFAKTFDIENIPTLGRTRGNGPYTTSFTANLTETISLREKKHIEVFSLSALSMHQCSLFGWNDFVVALRPLY